MLISRLPKLVLFIVIFIYSKHSFSQDFSFNGTGDFRDRFQAIALDNLGNSYLGGYTVREDEFTNYLVVKRDIDGNELWRKEFNGIADNADEIEDIAYDTNNNRLIVTGFSNSGFAGNDFWTIALNPTGEIIWSALYNDISANQYEQPNALAIDDNGNVFITGDEDSDPTSNIQKDALTVAYNSSGEFLWARKFDQAFDLDRGEDIAVTNGVIAVCGRSGNGGDDDYLVLGYDLQGNLLWSIVEDSGGTDRATAIDTDGVDSFYTTGRFDNGNDDDFYTLRISSSGAIVWTRTFDFVEDDRGDFIEVGANGNIYVAGRSDANATALVNYNYRVVVYNNASTLIWSSQYEGTGAGDDLVGGIATHADGSVSVCGISDQSIGAAISNDIVTVHFSNAGTTSWVKNVSANPAINDLAFGIVAHESGIVETIGSYDYSLIGVGTRAISNRYNGSNVDQNLFVDGLGDNADNVRAVGSFLDNNYLAGYTVSSEQNRNAILIKHNYSDTLWTVQLDGSLYGSDDDIVDMEVLPDGVVILGYIRNSGQGSDIFLNKYSHSGALLWSQFYNSGVNESDRPSDLVVATNGNIYVCGRTDIDPSFTSNNQRLVLAYNGNGGLLWTKIVNDGAGDDRCKFLAEANNYILVASRVSNGVDLDVEINAYDFNGNDVWTYSYNGGYNDDIEAFQLFDSGNLGLCISKYDPADVASVSAFVLLNSAGVLQWQDAWQSSAFGFNRPIIGSEFVNSFGTNSYFTAIDHPAPTEEALASYSVRILNDDGSLITAFTNESTTSVIADVASIIGNDIFLVCHKDMDETEGINYDIQMQHWSESSGFVVNDLILLGTVTDSSEIANISTLDYLAGSKRDQNQRDMFIWNFQWWSAIDELTEYRLSSYPNPFENTLNFTKPLTGSLFVFSSEARLVENINLRSSNRVDLDALSPGAYLLRIEQDGKVYFDKVVKK